MVVSLMCLGNYGTGIKLHGLNTFGKSWRYACAFDVTRGCECLFRRNDMGKRYVYRHCFCNSNI